MPDLGGSCLEGEPPDVGGRDEVEEVTGRRDVFTEEPLEPDDAIDEMDDTVEVAEFAVIGGRPSDKVV